MSVLIWEIIVIACNGEESFGLLGQKKIVWLQNLIKFIISLYFSDPERMDFRIKEADSYKLIFDETK